jgi:hypothetical protein
VLFSPAATTRNAAEKPQTRSEDIIIVPTSASINISSATQVIPNFANDNVLYYLAGRVAQKFKQFHVENECGCLEKVVVPRKNARFDEPQFQFFSALKANTTDDDAEFGGLTTPTKDFFYHVRIMNKAFDEKFDDIAHQVGLLDTLMNSSTSKFHIPSTCRRAFEKAEEYFFRTRIHYCCKSVNQSLITQKSCKENRKYKKIANL